MSSRLTAAGFVLAAFSFAVSNVHGADGRLGTKASSRSAPRSASLTTAQQLPHLPGKAKAKAQLIATGRGLLKAPVKPMGNLHLPTAAISANKRVKLNPQPEPPGKPTLAAKPSGSGVFQLLPEGESQPSGQKVFTLLPQPQSSGQKVFTLLPPPHPPAELMQFSDDKPKQGAEIIILSASETSNPEAYILQFDE